MWLYPLKILRVIRMLRIISFLEQLSGIIKSQYMQHQIFIENIMHVLVTVIVLVFGLHVLACCWISIGLEDPDGDLTEPWIVSQGLDVEPPENPGFIKMSKNARIYWTSWYFIATSITTVGYGDIAGTTTHERQFTILLMFFGLIIFSTIQHRTG